MSNSTEKTNPQANLSQSIQQALSQLETAYNPSEIEQGMYQGWEEAGYFAPTYGSDESFSIALPPPNVTGSLHMGHAFQQTIMDSLIRYHRMQGHNTLWQAGTDHAGIATQMVVERKIAKEENKTKHDYGRDAFIDKVWEWKAESGGNITRQMRRLGTTPDWTRERFTMDDGLSKVVKEVFVRLYEDDLLYRGKRLVNWDPALLTAISDVEVENKDKKGKMWHFRYPLADGKKTKAGDDHIVVATTRPETVLGDTGVAVNPDDDRYKDLIGSFVELPIVGRRIPIIGDEHADMTKGTGCVKITPAHDFNDYEVGKRHALPMINIFTPDAHIRKSAEVFEADSNGRVEESDVYSTELPDSYHGVERFQARKQLVAEMEELGLLVKVEDNDMTLPYGDRGGVIIEPMLTNQWYVRAEPLAKPAIEAVENGDIKFVPQQYENMYFSWMRDIQDWCISRQLWWGHRIPAWYDLDGNVYVGRDESEVRTKHNLGDDINLRQDDDVLDTWFSSGLWTFSTLGWFDDTQDPQETKRLLETFHPTSTLVTGFDIIFFWVARMVMLTMHFIKNDDGTPQVPFRDVYITGLIRDENGQKMSKTKGNVLDPLDMIDGIDLESLVAKRTANMMNPKLAEKIEKATRKTFPNGIEAHGTDALRFALTSLATTGRDINWDMQRLEGYRNFCNKIWNASRFVLMNCVDKDNNALPIAETANTDAWGLPEKWIISRLNSTIANIHTHFEQYRLDMVSQDIYEFIWNEYCDWYVELAKASLNDASVSEERKAQIRYVLLHVLETALRFTHPIMPFLTEELWQTIAPLVNRKAVDSLVVADFPVADNTQISEQTESDMTWLQDMIAGVRNIRGEMKLGNAVRLPVLLQGMNEEETARLSRVENQFKALAKVESLTIVNEGENVPLSSSSMVGQLRVLVPMKGLIDPTAELKRLAKAQEKLQKQAGALKGKLSNEGFVSKAPEAVVEAERAKLAELEGQLKVIEGQVEELEAL